MELSANLSALTAPIASTPGGPDYQISLVAGARNVSVDDPLAALVYGFAQLAREAALDRVQSESYAIQNRARLYHQIIEALDHHLEV